MSAGQAQLEIELIKLTGLVHDKNKSTREQLIEYFNHLIMHDFNQLIHLLYRIDVSEEKLKETLKEKTTHDASEIITDLIIERQQAKLNMIKNFNKNDTVGDEETW